MSCSCSVLPSDMPPLLGVLLLLLQCPKDADGGPIRGDTPDVQENWVSRLLQYVDSNPETLEELTNGDYAVLEGDLVLPRDRNAVESIWPTLKIPYSISPELAKRKDDILSAMKMVSDHTCVSFHRRIYERNYLLFKASRGCASYVGFIGGQQALLVGPPCIVGNIVHEILHALGFHHEHTRMDRDKYITVLPHNIMKGMEFNFKPQKGQTFNLSYDVSSILHYGSGFFSANGLPTIVPHGQSLNMGQRVHMTELDVQRVRHLYNCDAIEELKEGSKMTTEGNETTTVEGGNETTTVEGGNETTTEGHETTTEGHETTRKECGNETTKECVGREKGRGVKRDSGPERDSDVHKLAHYVVSSLEDQPEEDHRPTSASPSVPLHLRDAATRGQNDTRGQ